MEPSVELLLLTFNCARQLIDATTLAPHLFQALPTNAPLPSFLAISLQEIAPLAYSFLGGSYLTPYYARIVQSVLQAGKGRGVADADRYKLVTVQNVGLTALMIFARPEVAERIQWVQSAGTGVGLWEMGNKGAVGLRIGLVVNIGEIMEMTFVAAHLAPHEDAILRRNQDWENIVRNLVFVPAKDKRKKRKSAKRSGTNGEEEELVHSSDDSHSSHSSHSSHDEDDEKPISTQTTIFTPNSHVFFSGDLNYRTHTHRPDPDSYKTFPQPVASTSHDRHFSHLLEKDQLSAELSAGRTLHGLTEQPITFPPTYKYAHDPANTSIRTESTAIEEPTSWSWSRRRWPSWCDRILFLPSADLKAHEYVAMPLQSTSDHRPVALHLTIEQKPVKVSRDDIRRNPPFKLNPDWRRKRARARQLEVVVGILAYLVLTREGNAILAGLLAGGVAGYYLLRSLL